MLMARHESNENLEIFDEQGVRMGNVTRPDDPRLFGPQKGTVYLNRPLPHLPESPLPAHAA